MKLIPIRLMLVLGVLALSAQLSANELSGYTTAMEAAVAAGERPDDQIRITFPYSVSLLQESFGSNAASLRDLKDLAHKHMKDLIMVMAYASPEGTPAFNLALSEKRGQYVKDYLVSAGFPAGQIVVQNAGEDWDGLKCLISSKQFEGKDEVLRILDNESLSSVQKQEKIRAIGGGRTWGWLTENVMPELRSVQVSVFSKESLQKFLSGDWTPGVVPQEPKQETQPVVEEPKPVVEEPKPVVEEKQPEPEKPAPDPKGKITVTGQIVDAADGEPIIGAGVIPSTGGGTITDYDGRYSITVPTGASLTFSQMGYASVTEAVDGRSVINLAMSQDTQLLEEVVVLGFTTQKKAELTSAVVSMDGEKLRDVTTPDVGNMLQGKVAGVMVMNSSGQPGSEATIRIRGTGSITAGAGPLYVVDGVAGGSFNPNDIETITVLKDASATALYGAAASGGVIVVTTKSAKSDKATVNFKASAGVKKALTGRFKTMDAYEMYDFCSLLYNKSAMRSQTPAVKPTEGESDYDTKLAAWKETMDQHNFNWTDAVFKMGVVQDYYASISGKAGKVSYFTSLDHYNERGSMINTGYKRTGGRINLSAPITSRLNMNVRLNYHKDYTDGEQWRTREYVNQMMPFDVPYVMDENGNYTSEPLRVDSDRRADNNKKWYSKNAINVLHSEKYNYAKSHGEEFTGDLQLVWNPLDWLTITSTTRYDSSNSYSEEYVDPRTLEVEDSKGELKNTDGEWNGWGTTNIAKFHKVFGDAHDVNAIVGWEYSEGYSRTLSAKGDQMPAGQRSLSNTIMLGISGRDYNTRAWALLSQAQYSYLGKYILTASLRYDESYKFGPDNRGGFFPGVSAAWVMSNENFLKNQDFLTFLKMRAGFGKTGNDAIDPFQYQDTFSLTAQYYGVVAAFLERQANYSLGWEEAYMTSLGWDATIKDNWNVTLDLYHTINTKLLLDRPKPPSTGFFSVMDNVGKVRNMGVELAVDGAILKTRDFRWDVGFNVGLNQNRVLDLPDKEFNLTRSEVTQMVRVGEPIYSWYMPKWMGVDVETGKPLWEHIEYEYDDDGNVIGELERTITDMYGDATPQLVGNATPWLTGGLNMAVSWKGLTLSANGSFMVGNKIFNRTRWAILDTDGAQQQFNQQSLNNGLGWYRWKEGDPDGTNAIATHPEAKKGGNSGAHNLSSRYLEDGSFFRLRNVTLSYDLPKNLISKVKMSGARVYVSADNLLTLTRFSGMDPEVTLELASWTLPGMYSDIYPVPMSVVMGIDITF